MANADLNQNLITEEMVEQFYRLNKQAKEVEKQLTQLKKTFNQYFDLTVGKNQKGSIQFGSFVLQRQIRVSEKFREEETIEKLEKLHLADCIKIVKQVDEEKIKAAMTLGLLSEETLSDYKERKQIPVIAVKQL